jgi:hypothetical protein
MLNILGGVIAKSYSDLTPFMSLLIVAGIVIAVKELDYATFRSESLYKISSYFATLHSINLIVWLLTTIKTNSLIGEIKIVKETQAEAKVR